MNKIHWPTFALGVITTVLARELVYIADQFEPAEERWAAVFVVAVLAAACVWLWRRLPCEARRPRAGQNPPPRFVCRDCSCSDRPEFLRTGLCRSCAAHNWDDPDDWSFWQ